MGDIESITLRIAKCVIRAQKVFPGEWSDGANNAAEAILERLGTMPKRQISEQRIDYTSDDSCDIESITLCDALRVIRIMSREYITK